MSFSERFKQLRKAKGLSLKKVADDIGTTPQSLSLYETGQRTINIDLLEKISNYFNVSTDYLLGLSDVSTYDTSMISASKYTGLSEKAINAIKSLTKEDKAKINRLFENEKFLKLVTILSDSEVF